MKFTLFEIVSLVGLAQGFFLSVLLLFRTNNKTANYFLSALIALASLLLLYNLVLRQGILASNYSLMVFANTIVFLFPALHLLYAVFLLNPHRSNQSRFLLHFLPFVIFNILLVPVFLGNEKAISMVNRIIGNNYNNLLSSVYSIVMMMLVLRLLQRHTHSIKSSFSSIEHINLRWLKTITFLIIVFDILFVLLLFLPVLLRFNPAVPNLILSLLMVVLIYITAFYGFRQPGIIKGVAQQIESPKYKTSGLSEAKAIEIEQKLLYELDHSKPFLTEGLTINGLAKILDTHPAYLSQVINENLGSNFYNLINKYRINEAQGLMLSPENSKLKLEAIAYDSGFKSKSTFNEAFKRNTGLTPSQFRKKMLRS